MADVYLVDPAAYRAGLIAARESRYEREITAGVRAPIYRGYHIYYDPPPIPLRSCDWHFYHDDYDGAPDGGDRRCGSAPSADACREEIDLLEGSQHG